MVGGTFTKYDTTDINRLARLNSDGSIDTSFKVGYGFNYNVNAISVQANGKIIVAGAFQYYDSTEVKKIVRLQVTNCTPTSAEINGSACSVYTAPDGAEYTSSGIYYAIIPNADGCDSTIKINLTIPVIDTAVTISSNSFAAKLDGATYKWVDCLGDNVVSTNQSYSLTYTGSFKVVVSYNGCSDTSNCFSYTKEDNGINVNSSFSQLKISPNPVKDLLSVNIGSVNSSVLVQIFDITGRSVFVENKKNIQFFNLNTSTLPQGIYFIKLSKEGNNAVQKFVIE